MVSQPRQKQSGPVAQGVQAARQPTATPERPRGARRADKPRGMARLSTAGWEQVVAAIRALGAPRPS